MEREPVFLSPEPENDGNEPQSAEQSISDRAYVQPIHGFPVGTNEVVFYPETDPSPYQGEHYASPEPPPVHHPFGRRYYDTAPVDEPGHGRRQHTPSWRLTPVIHPDFQHHDEEPEPSTIAQGTNELPPTNPFSHPPHRRSYDPHPDDE